MDNIFEIDVYAREDADIFDAESLSLPATYYELREVLDRYCPSSSDRFYLKITGYCDTGGLNPFMRDEFDQCGPRELYELNALAQRISELDTFGRTAFKGLLKMEAEKTNVPIEVPRLINLAHSTECCHVVYEAMNDSQLGRFLAENGLAPETEDVPDSVFELLDFEQIGRKHRAAEGSVFVERDFTSPGAYVERHDDIVEAYKELEPEPKIPDYTVLLNLECGGKHAQLKLPAGEQDLNAALEQMGAQDWNGVSWWYADCAVPALAGMISGADDLNAINTLAQKLADMEPDTLLIYKSLLEATECGSFINAERLTGELDEYRLAPRIRSFTQCAEERLAAVMPKEDAALLIPHLNLYSFGKSLLQEKNAVMTSYGLIQRLDGQPIQALETQPQQGGMEMM